MAATVTKGGPSAEQTEKGRGRVLGIATTGFTLMFAVWLMFGVLGVKIREEFGLTDVEFSWLTAVAILNGSIWRLPAGLAADRWGGRAVSTAMLLFTAVPAFLIAYVTPADATSYGLLLTYAFLVGFAGNSFTSGIAWVSAWWPQEKQGTALGIFGAGNVGASVTKFIGPWMIAAIPAPLLAGFIPGGWRAVPWLYGVLLVVMAAVTWFGTPSHDHKPGKGRSMRDMMRPLKQVRVWRFSLYYAVVFGAYVALSSWLPKYYVDNYDLELSHAALLTALFIFPASLLRPVGGYFSDKLGARRVMYATFGAMLLASGILMMPYGFITLELGDGSTREVLPWNVGVVLFTILVFVIGCSMGIGKAAVYKHIPEYFPKDVGAVGGLVGSLGALGGFFLPPAFAYAERVSGMPQATFFVLFLLTAVSAIWMHITVVKVLHRASPDLEHKFEHEDASSDAPAKKKVARKAPQKVG